MRCFVGVDGGGTKTAAVVLDEGLREIGRGYGGPCNIATCDDAALRESVTSSVESALAAAGLARTTRFAGACAGVAGYTAKKRRAHFEQIFAESVRADTHRVEPDYLIAYWGAAEGEPGIVVIAGTGAAVYGRNANGDSARVDGRGYLLGDQGSAFWIGLQGLTSIITATDHGEPLREFHHRLLRETGCEDADDVVEWLYRGFSASRVAELARPIGQWAESGDAQALKLIDMAATALATDVYYAARRLGVTVDSLPVYLLGGLWDTTPLMADLFERGLRGYVNGEGASGEARESGEADPWIRRGRQDAAIGAGLLAAGGKRKAG